jgi:serine beta-lactamase-like protein LACTB
VTLTTRQLVSHLSGVRHYEKKEDLEKKKREEEEQKKAGQKKKRRRGADDDDEFAKKEYYLKDSFESTGDALKLFKDDELISKPGEQTWV